MVEVINSDAFKSEVEAYDGVAIVDFFATWCGPCKMLAPVLEQLSNEMDGQAKFLKVDIDASLDLARQFNISSVPTMVIFKDGKPVDTLVGFVPKENIAAKLKAQL